VTAAGGMATIADTAAGIGVGTTIAAIGIADVAAGVAGAGAVAPAGSAALGSRSGHAT
jgi:hypothetical protein